MIALRSCSRSERIATVKYKRDPKALEQRRRKGMRMLARGLTQAEVARALDVSRQTMSNWARAPATEVQAWRRKPLGRPAGLSAAEKSRLSKRLEAAAVACGFPTELWTLARVGSTAASRIRARVQHRACVAVAARAGMFQPAPHRARDPV